MTIYISNILTTLIGLILISNQGLILKLGGGDIGEIDVETIKYLILILTLGIILYNIIKQQYIPKRIRIEGGEKENKNKELLFLITSLMMGGLILVITKDLFVIIIGFTIINIIMYILILTKSSFSTKNSLIFYSIIGSLCLGLLILGVIFYYLNKGKWNINIEEDIEISLFIYSSLFIFVKIGLAPFTNILTKIYLDVETRILVLLLIIPKFILSILFIKFLFYGISSIFFNSNYILILFFLSFITLIIGCIGGIIQERINNLLIYSSFIQIGVILSIVIINILSLFNRYSYIPEIYINNYIYNITNYTIFGEYLFYLFCYFITLIAFSSIYFYSYKFANADIYIIRFKVLFLLNLIIVVLSFIGIPPFPCFFSKLYLFSTTININYNYETLISFILLFFSSLFSSFLYLKFILSPLSSLSLSLPLSFKPLYPFPLPFPYLIQPTIFTIISLLSCFILLFPLFLPYLLSLFF